MTYKISCLDCDVSYVGQIKRKIKTRIKEYKANIKRKLTYNSIETHLEYGHELDWKNISLLDSLLDSEPCFQKRFMSEMIFIKKQIKVINIQNDTECLPEAFSFAYYSFLHLIPGLPPPTVFDENYL